MATISSTMSTSADRSAADTPPSRYHHGDLPAALRSAAAALLAESGPSGFSLREVARRVGVSNAAPAHHYGSARGLLTSVAIEGFEQLEQALAAAAASSDDPIEQFRAAGYAYVRTAREYPGHYSVMFEHEAIDGDDESLAAAGGLAHERLVEALERIRDTVNPELDVEAASAMVWATMAGLVVLAPVFEHLSANGTTPPCAIDDLIDRFTGYFMTGFRSGT